MKKNYSILILCIPCLFGLISCDEDYDLSKDINTEINVGGDYLSFPVGSIKSIAISELLDVEDDDNFQFLEDGTLALSYNGDIVADGLSIPGVNIKEVVSDIPSFVLNVPGLDSDFETPPSLGLEGVEVKIPVSISEVDGDIEISENVPVEIKKLISINMAINSQGLLPKLNIYTIFAGLPSNVESIVMKEFTIVFSPEFQITQYSDLDSEMIGQTFVSNEALIRNEKGEFVFSKNLDIEAFDLGEDNNYISVDGNGDNRLKFTGEVTIKGAIEVSGIALLPTDLKEITGAPFITLNEMTFSVVEGIFSPNVVVDPEMFSFKDIPEFLKGNENTNLDLLNSVIKLEMGNTLDIPMNATVKITPIIKDEQQSNMLSVPLYIKSADVNSTGPVVSKFWISELEPEGNLYKYINEDVGKLINPIPDSLSISVDVKADENVNHIIDLTKTYDLTVGYGIEFPMTLGSEFAIMYEDTVKNISNDIKDIITLVSSLSLDVDVDNGVPLNMGFGIIAYDKNYKVIDGVDVAVEGIIKSATINETAEGGTEIMNSKIKVVLTEKQDGKMDLLNSLGIRVTADAIESGVSLNKKQSLKLSLKAQVPGGINVDLDE